MRRDFPVVASLALLLLLVPGMILPHPSPPSAVRVHPSLSVDGPIVIISEFYPCGVDYDEYIVLWNGGSDEVVLTDWTISDGEGVLLFTTPIHILPGDEVHISSNDDSFVDAFGVPPEVTVQGWNTNESGHSLRFVQIGRHRRLHCPPIPRWSSRRFRVLWRFRCSGWLVRESDACPQTRRGRKASPDGRHPYRY